MVLHSIKNLSLQCPTLFIRPWAHTAYAPLIDPLQNPWCLNPKQASYLFYRLKGLEIEYTLPKSGVELSTYSVTMQHTNQ